MTPINSLIRSPALDLSIPQNFPSSDTRANPEQSAGNGHSPISFASQPQNSQVNFASPANAFQPQNSNVLNNAGGQNDPLTQLVTLIQDLLQRLQALMQGNTGSTNDPSSNAVSGGGGGGGGGKVGGGSGYSPVDDHGSTINTPQTGKTGGSTPAAGNFSEHSLGNQLSVQKSPEDAIGMAKDPERGDVIKVDFNKGHYTEHSTSPRAEIKDGTKLQEGQPYSFKFGMKREANNDGTFFQVLDHNNAKPSPRAWLATKDGQYQLHLKTSEDSNAPSKVFNIGKPGDAAKDVGKWADFQIDFKRGIGDGEISVTKNGQNVFDQKGISTMFDTHSSDSYAKFGQYRNEGDHNPATSLFSGFSVAKG